MTPTPAQAAERLPQILLRIAAGLGVLLIAVVVNALLHSDGEALNPVAAAAERTQKTPGARLAIEAVYTSADLPDPIVATGGGVYNGRSGRTSVTLTVPGPVSEETVESVGDEETVFVHSAAIAAELPAGKLWLGLQPWIGHSKETTIAGSGGTKDELEMLRAIGDDVESAGEQKVRGVLTERYRGSIDLGHLAQLLREEGKTEAAEQYEELAEKMPAPIEVEAWIDGGGILRREQMVIDLPTSPGRAPVAMDMRIELFDFGIAPKIHFPDSDEVFDATLIARAELGQLDGSTARRLIHPAAGAALTRAAFERRGNAICRRVSDQVKALLRDKAPLLEAIKHSEADSEALREALRNAGLGLYAPIVRRAEAALSALGRLNPAPPASTAFSLFLNQSALEAELLGAMTSALELGDLGLVRKLEEQSDQLSAESDRLATEAGLTACRSEKSSAGSSSPA